MMTLLFSVAAFALQQPAVGTTATSLQVAAEVSTVIIAMVLLLLLVVSLALAWQLKKLVAALRNGVQPAAERARAAAENVEYISAVVREDVQSVRASLSGLSDRLKEASERMEERVEEFNALMDVVQDETESVLIDTAAVVRGVRAGAQTMGEGMADGKDDLKAGDEAGEAMAREAPEGA